MKCRDPEHRYSFNAAAKLKYDDLFNNAFPQCDEFWMLGHSFDTMLDYALSSNEVSSIT